MTRIARRYDSAGAKRRILSACVRLFIEQGYRQTTLSEIIRLADVSASTFQNIFDNKSGVLFTLTEFMFENQFAISREIIGENAAPVLLYAVETSLQLALAELNENLRENYLQAYTTPNIVRYINQSLARILHTLFAPYRPHDSEEDFYQLEIGTSGIMRSYISVPCSETFPLELKIRRFLDMSLLAYSVPEEERRAAIEYVAQMDIRRHAAEALQRLFDGMATKFQFTFTDEH